MTSLVTQATRDAILSGDYASASNVFGGTIVILAIVALLARELVRAAGGPRAADRMRVLDIVTVPILLAFVVVEAARIAYVIL